MNEVKLSAKENCFGRIERLWRVLQVIEMYAKDDWQFARLLRCIVELHDHEGLLTVTLDSSAIPMDLDEKRAFENFVRTAWNLENEDHLEMVIRPSLLDVLKGQEKESADP